MENKFAAVLRSLIIECDKPLKQIAIEVDMPPSSLSKYQNNQMEPSISNLIKLAIYFNVSLDFLAGMSNIKN